MRVFINSIGTGLVFALPWLSLLAMERLYPGSASASLSTAFVFSLIASGGFAVAINRRSRFYLSTNQSGLGAIVAGYVFRVGLGAAIGGAVAGVAAGWLSGSYAWPALVLWADQLVILSAVWLTCAVLTARDQPWRVLAAFTCGAAAFAAARLLGAGAMPATLVAAGMVLIAGGLQARRIFAEPAGQQRPSMVPRPRMGVLLFQLLPSIGAGTLFFCVLLMHRVLRLEGRAAIDIAVLAVLFGAGIVARQAIAGSTGSRAGSIHSSGSPAGTADAGVTSRS
jgi:hypothetical protein